MRFYSHSKKFVCGVDLHARECYICIIDRERKVLVHKKVRNRNTDMLLSIIEPYKNDIVVACESCYA